MANTIFFREMSCQCSNGCTDVLLTVIGLSGSKSAQTDDEKNMIIWLMEKDQSAVGMGTVGFDISEMPWKKACFENQKHFMLQVLDAARAKTGWETLEYSPNEEIMGFCYLFGAASHVMTICRGELYVVLVENWLDYLISICNDSYSILWSVR